MWWSAYQSRRGNALCLASFPNIDDENRFAATSKTISQIKLTIQNFSLQFRRGQDPYQKH